MRCMAFIAARMGSERMPGKVLKNLSGLPALVHIFNILRESENLDDFAVVTTALSEDDEIENVCIENSVKVVRGSVHDVLDRFRQAANIFKPETIVRVTGDDPLMDSGIIDKVIEAHFTGDYDYTSNIIKRTFPRGMDTEVMRYSALEKSWRTTADKDDHEHVTLFIRRNPELFKLKSVESEGEAFDNLRLCLDTEKDYELISEIYTKLYKGKPIKLYEILNFLNDNPELKNINSEVMQKSVKGKIF